MKKSYVSGGGGIFQKPDEIIQSKNFINSYKSDLRNTELFMSYPSRITDSYKIKGHVLALPHTLSPPCFYPPFFFTDSMSGDQTVPPPKFNSTSPAANPRS